METLLEILIPILCQIESGNDPNAIGDNGRAVGILQIHKIMVDDVNRIKCRHVWDYERRYSPFHSRLMCKTYMKHYAPSRIEKHYAEVENLIILGRIWNGGPMGYLKKSTEAYGEKVRKLYNERK